MRSAHERMPRTAARTPGALRPMPSRVVPIFFSLPFFPLSFPSLSCFFSLSALFSSQLPVSPSKIVPSNSPFLRARAPIRPRPRARALPIFSPWKSRPQRTRKSGDRRVLGVGVRKKVTPRAVMWCKSYPAPSFSQFRAIPRTLVFSEAFPTVTCLAKLTPSLRHVEVVI